MGFDAALARDDGAAHLAAFADIVVAPDNAALDAVVVVDDRVVADDRRAVDPHITLDFDFIAQIDRSKKLGAGRDFHIFARLYRLRLAVER